MSTLVRFAGAVRAGRPLVRVAVKGRGGPQLAWHVVPGGAGVQSGRSWRHAFATVQDGIDAADASADIKEVWVKLGTYTRVLGASFVADLTAATGVSVYGGFAGTEKVRADRDWVANVTVLDGEDNDRVVRLANVIVDGFTIQDGFNALDGGGLIASTAGWTLENCIITGCTARNGGGIYISGNTGTINTCQFIGNHATVSGGATYNHDTSDCTFTGNTSDFTGGATYSGAHARATFTSNSASGGGAGRFGTYTDCVFTTNTSPQGGALAEGSSTRCKFLSNSAQFGGATWGGIHINALYVGNTATLDGGGAIYGSHNCCTFSGNSASDEGGGCYRGGGKVNSIFWGNTAPSGPQLHLVASATYCDVQGGYAGVGNIDADPLFVAGYRIPGASPCKNAGTAAGAPANDLDGNVRPYPGTAVDMGCYEYQGA